jgi:hypothetical protein
MLALALGFLSLPLNVSAAGAPVAVFPLQELAEGRNDVNLPFTRILSEHLANIGSEIIGPEMVITFMANNRIRTTGHLDTFRISRVRTDLGAAFVLLGTISQRKELPEPSLGLTMNLVRTSDARTVWTYVGSFSSGEERKILGIGEPRTTDDLQPLLLNEIRELWPFEVINSVQQVGAINIDSTVLKPMQVAPGGEVRGKVRLRDNWPAGQEPRVFFKVDDQLYPATVSEDGHTYEGSWVAGEKAGSFPVSMLLEWPYYGRTETALLGNILIDGTPPLFELELPDAQLIDGQPVFTSQLRIIPRMIVRKPLSHWRLAFYRVDDAMIGDMTGKGNMPRSFVWTGRHNSGDGEYEVVLEAWDKAGNYAKASRLFQMNRSLPKVDMVLQKSDKQVTVNLEHDGKIPLKNWKLEMWTNEGRLLTQAEGEDLPVTVEFEMPAAAEGQQIEGSLSYRDVLGNKVHKKIGDLLPKLGKKSVEKKEPTGISESWVDDF